MEDFHIEYYIYNGDKKNVKFSDLNEKKTEKWKKNMEARALSEYYSRKIKS